MPTTMFGTDGVRGTPGCPPLDDDTVMWLGAAVVAELGERDRGHRPGERPHLVCGRDTRASGGWIEQRLAAGIAAAGGRLTSIGVMPTPGVAFITKHHGFDAGVVISASHNPFPDNGIKVLRATGEKVSADFERRVEARVAARSPMLLQAPRPPGSAEPIRPSGATAADTLAAAYEDHLVGIVGDTDVSTISLAVDCGHGATTPVIPRVLGRLGVSPIVLHAAPDGRNINAESGSTHPDTLQRVVVERRCRLGFAFDGDGDRVVLVDRCGRLVDGDGVLFLAARQLRAAGRLTGGGVVATVMSNFGLEAALARAGIALYRCPVGDSQVREEMRRRGVCLGGEQSGHIIFSDLLPTGDGVGTALSVLRMMAESGRELDALVAGLTLLPQVMVNVEVADTPPLSTVPALARAIRTAEDQLAGRGRVLVRYSGTEPLLRIMLEGPEQATVVRLADAIAACARRQLGRDH